MKTYTIGHETVDSVELKCLVVSRGLKVDKKIYRRFSKDFRLHVNPLCCNCFFLSDGTIVQLTDMGFHLSYLGGMLSWDNLKLLRYASELGTPFSLVLDGDKGEAVLLHDGVFVDYVTFPEKTDFYTRKTAGGLSYAGNTVLQGVDWVAFQCLWPCEYAAKGKPCQFCFSGAEHEKLGASGKPLPAAVSPADAAEIVQYAVEHVGVNSVQLTGGSTFSGVTEETHIRAYLEAIRNCVQVPGEILLYLTPPKRLEAIDDYFALGASRIAASLEVWDENLAADITPGKIAFTTRAKYLETLEYTVNRHGSGTAFSNFIIGLEPFESLAAGAEALAARGIIPTASVWMPMGRPVRGSMKAPNVDYYRRVKELFAELYVKYKLEPAACCGLNVCVERDIFRYGMSGGCACK